MSDQTDLAALLHSLRIDCDTRDHWDERDAWECSPVDHYEDAARLEAANVRVTDAVPEAWIEMRDTAWQAGYNAALNANVRVAAPPSEDAARPYWADTGEPLTTDDLNRAYASVGLPPAAPRSVRSEDAAPLRYIGGVLHQPECNGVVCPESLVGECVTEAVVAERARLAEAVRGLPESCHDACTGDGPYAIHARWGCQCEAYLIDAVLALLTEPKS